jgi:hypothetical protein
MKRHRTIASTLVLLAGTLAAPSAALASGPLLSGYGPPGAGAQTILGASLVNGPSGGSGGGSGGAGSGATGAGAIGGGASASGTAGAAGHSAATPRSAAGSTRPGHGGRAGRRSPTTAGAPTGTQSRAAGANPKKSQLGAATLVSASESPSWFSGSDLLALALASGVLALVALATIRLARTEHD